mgnify:CR=1 FL=1
MRKKNTVLCVLVTLACVSGCLSVKPVTLTVQGGERIAYQCENGVRVVVRYYSLSDGSLDFVKVLMPDGKEYTLPGAVSASGARYTDDRELVWWTKGDSAFVQTRGQTGEWQIKYQNCQTIREKR